MSPSDAGSFVAIHEDEDSSRRCARQIETYSEGVTETGRLAVSKGFGLYELVNKASLAPLAVSRAPLAAFSLRPNERSERS